MELLKLLKIFTSSVLVILVFMACATTKHKLVKTSNIEKEAIYSKHDSVHIITINQPIEDVIFLSIATGDTKIDSAITKRLTNFKTYKKSGDNSYEITYNTSSKGFEITSKIGRTENTLVKKNDSINRVHKKAVLIEKDKLIIKDRVPSWLLLVFGISLIVVYFLARFKII